MSLKDWGIDVFVAVAAFLFGCMQLVLVTSSFVMPDETLRRLLGIDAIVPSTAAYVAVALTVVPIALRRRFPWPVFVFTLVMFVLMQSSFRGYSLTIIGPLIALCTIASERPRAEAIAAGVLALAGLTLAGSPAQSVTLTFLTRFQNMAIMAAGAFGGYAFKTHREYVRATEQRALEAERTREEEAARRVEEERVRIAREVHDITAHSLSAVSIQAAAAERLVETLDEPYACNGYEAEIQEAQACLRAGKLQSHVVPWAYTRGILPLIDRLKARFGVRYPGDEG